jgi:hypothetical protein
MGVGVLITSAIMWNEVVNSVNSRYAEVMINSSIFMGTLVVVVVTDRKPCGVVDLAEIATLV